MILAPYPIPAVVYLQQTSQNSPVAVFLSSKDPRLEREILPKDVAAGNFATVAKWVKLYAKVSIGTEEVHPFLARHIFIFDKVKAGDLMEAYSLRLRMRWVKYREGQPVYGLTTGKQAIDAVYLPRDEFQKRRFDATKSFINGFDGMTPQVKSGVLAGQPLKYAVLPQAMRDAIDDAFDACLDGKVASSPGYKKPDISILSKGEILIEDKSKPETGIREMWISINTGLFDVSYRWNDYNKDRTKFPDAKPIDFAYDPTSNEFLSKSNESLSKEKILERYPKLGTKVTIKQGDWELLELLRYLSKNYGVNFIADFEYKKRFLPFSCEETPLSEVMDKICKVYRVEANNVDWEWKVSAGDFIVMRPQDNLANTKTAFTTVQPPTVN